MERNSLLERQPTDELDGLVDLGLHKEAMELGLALMASGFSTAATLQYVAITLLFIAGTLTSREKPLYRQAMISGVSKLPPGEKREGLSSALIFFVSLNMNLEALKILNQIDSPPSTALEAAMTLQLLKSKRNADKRAKIVESAQALLDNCEDEETRNLLRNALKNAK